MLKIIILAALIMPGISHALNLKKHPIYSQIIANKPGINKKYAMKLSNIIYKKARKYNIDSKIFTAILAQESMYTMKVNNCTTGIVEVEQNDIFVNMIHCDVKYKVGSTNFIQCIDNKPKYKEIKICTDFGISQVHYSNVKKLGLSIDKLVHDLDYSVEQGAKILSYFTKRYKKREPNTYWSRYNASSHEKRLKYEQLVRRYF